MPPKTKKDSPTERNLSDPSSNLIDNDETEQAPEQTGIYEAIISDMFYQKIIIKIFIFYTSCSCRLKRLEYSPVKYMNSIELTT